ncbi:MAG: branched-chain amino acid ABC transporter permease [Actinobacteria bacterium]|nr:branched-chain amino acid ABC transporter permease [Actinomycetota bacterium]
MLFWLGENLVRTPADFYQNFVYGATNGLLYGLIAIGYSLVYGILELINFAHGDVFMLGSMMATTFVGVTILGLTAGSAWYVLWPGIIAALLISMAFCGTLNASIERVAYRRLRTAPRLAPLITAIGMSFILQNVGLVWKGPRPISTVDILPHGAIFTIGGVAYTWSEFFVVAVTLPTLALLVWLVQRTRHGKAMRATAQDREAAAMMGIDVDRTISFTFLLAGALAGVAGTVFALYNTNTSFLTGFRTGLIAFTAAVLGGIGNLPGAVLGAMLIGLLEGFSDGLAWHALGSQWTEAVIFAILIIILVLRPEGLLGERTPEGG